MPTSPMFNSLDADLVLRSSLPDAVNFRVHRCILSAASPFFEHMFTLPQPSSEESCDPPVIDVSESASTLTTLLQLVYPRSNPSFSTLDELTTVLEAACKYDLVVAVDHLRTLLVAPRFLEADPLRVYAIACRFDLEDEARIASRHTLHVNVLDAPLTDDLKFISAFQYRQLLNLHRRRAAAALELLHIPDEVKCMMCNGTHYGAFHPPRWWKDFEERAKKELAARPTTDIVFSMPFLAQSAQAGCERCAGSVLAAHWFFDQLKRSIDELPSTI